MWPPRRPDILQEYSEAPLEEVTTKSSPTDLVSEADRASEAYILSSLRKARPDDSVQGEEGASHVGTSGISWVADPLDGTTNFFFRVPAYAVSLAGSLQRADGRRGSRRPYEARDMVGHLGPRRLVQRRRVPRGQRQKRVGHGPGFDRVQLLV